MHYSARLLLLALMLVLVLVLILGYTGMRGARPRLFLQSVHGILVGHHHRILHFRALFFSSMPRPRASRERVRGTRTMLETCRRVFQQLILILTSTTNTRYYQLAFVGRGER